MAPFPPTSFSSSSSSPPLLPPFIGSRISKSLVVKNAAALLRSACHARFLPTRTDGRTGGRADRHGGGIASVGRAAARRTAGRASAKERNLNRADISPSLPKVAKPSPSTQHAKICATRLTEGFRVRDFFIRSAVLASRPSDAAVTNDRQTSSSSPPPANRFVGASFGHDGNFQFSMIGRASAFPRRNHISKP